MSDKVLYLIDGHSQVFKAYHAIQHLTTSKGVPTNATFGFVQILGRLMKSRKPEYLAVVFDCGEPTFRHEMYAEYKANRAEAPEDLGLQMEQICRILAAMRVPILQKPGFEADDIIATLAARATTAGYKTVVVTADKDLFQLVNDDVQILRLDPASETLFDREGVKTKMGVYPEQIRDYLAMVGDSSDNVPGIARIGPKSAVTLLEKYGTLEEVLAKTSELTGKQKEYVEAGRESALLSQKLVSLHYDVPVDGQADGFGVQQPDNATLADIYRELEFRRQLEELDVPAQPTARPIVADYRAITTEEELRELCSLIAAEKLIAFDVETDSLDTTSAKLAGISVCVKAGTAAYIPLTHVGTMGSAADMPQLPLDVVRRHLNPLLADKAIRKIAHHAKFDWKMMRKCGFTIDCVEFDTLLASYILNPDRRNHGLKDLAADLLGLQMTRIDELIGSGKSQITFDQVEIGRAVPYASADADVTRRLESEFSPKLDAAQSRKLFDEIEMPLVPVLMSMEETGVCIDDKHFAMLADEMRAHLDRLRAAIYQSVGQEFNIGSPKQVASILFDVLKLSPGKSKKTGYSTAIDVLEQLAQEHEVPRLLAEYRQFEKLMSTYVEVLPSLVSRATGRIHTSYNQAVAATGRLSSSDPNLQNIPVRTEYGRKIRQGFVPSDRERNVLLSADYSQIELRVLAHVTGDPALVEAYTKDVDIHTLTASKVYGVAQSDVNSEMRSVAKMVNFGVIYGMSAQGLSSRLKIPMATAKSFIDEYFKGYAGVRSWLDRTLAEARERGYVETVSGRRRYLTDIKSKNFNARSAAERVAVNAPVQGTSADMIKIAMINIQKRLMETKMSSRMIMQVHDELIFDAPKAELDALQTMVIREMQNALPLAVPVKVEAGFGANWAEC